MYEQIVLFITNGFAQLFDGVGAAIVVWASFMAIFKFVHKEFFNGKEERMINRDQLRLDFGHRMLLGVEFFLAGDLIRTVATPTWDSIGKLGALVVIRTVLSFFLTRELDLKK